MLAFPDTKGFCLSTSDDTAITVEDIDDLESMDDLLNEPGGELKSVSRSDVLEGLIVGIEPDELLIDIGLKAEGVVPSRELWDSRSDEPKPSFDLGDTVLVYVVQPEGDGPALLSVRRAAQEKVWRATEELFETGAIIEATIQEYNKGGVLVDVGPRGFVPLSQLTILRRGPADETEEELNAKLADVVGQTINVKVIELDRRRNRLILSQRVAEREVRSQKREILLDELEIGQVRKGIVSNICSFGAFIDLGGADGLAHISELSWSRVENPEELLKPGEEIDAYVLALDQEDKKIALSLRRATKDPWADLDSRYEDGSIVEGDVTKLAPFGAFVRLEDGVEGLAHSSDLGDTSLDSIHEGTSGKFRILSTDVPRRRIRLEPTEFVVETEDPSDAESVDGEEPDIDEVSGSTDVDPDQQPAAAAEAVRHDDTNTEADDSIDEADDSKSTVKAAAAAAEEETDEDTSSDSADIVDEDAMIESKHKAES
jgi:small subunit ribosomal protein S1